MLISLLLLVLKQDGNLNIDYKFVILPVWILWKLSVFASTVIGIIILINHPTSQDEETARRLQAKITVYNLVLHILLVIFEWLVCSKLDSSSDILWLSVFTPLIAASIMTSYFCYWSVQRFIIIHNLERCVTLSLPLFILIPLKLDDIITVSWEIVFIPALLILFMCVVKLVFEFIFHYIAREDTSPNGRKGTRLTLLLFAFICFPLLVFQALLVNRLDDHSQMPFSVVTLPLIVSLIAAIIYTFISTESDNFGMRNFSILLSMMGIYGEVSINTCCCLAQDDDEIEDPQVNSSTEAARKTPVLPRYSFEIPD
jgi:hypothetical protein